MEEKIIAARRIARTRSSALNNRSSGWGAGVCFQKGVGLPVSRGWARPPPEFISTECWLVVICRGLSNSISPVVEVVDVRGPRGGEWRSLSGRREVWGP